MPSTDSGVRPSPRIAASNAGFEGASGAGAQSPCFARPLRLFLPVTANYLPVTAKSSPCYCPVPRAPPNFAQPIVIQIDFPAKTGPETGQFSLFSACYQGVSGESDPQAR